MKSCRVCGASSWQDKCEACGEVAQLVLNSEPGSLVLVVDGSVDTENAVGKKNIYRAGAGLVLARAEDEAVIAVCAAEFDARHNNEAEFQAIVRGLRWAPSLVAWSDSLGAIRKAESNKLPAAWIPVDLRDPLHNLAHRLANCARKQDYARMDRLWIPGAVW